MSLGSVISEPLGEVESAGFDPAPWKSFRHCGGLTIVLNFPMQTTSVWSDYAGETPEGRHFS